MKIDHSKPIILVESHGQNPAPYRKFEILEVCMDGSIFIKVPEGLSNWIKFDEYGQYVRSDRGKTVGSALSLINYEAPPKTYDLTLTAEEMALLRVLVGNVVGGGLIAYDLFRKLGRKGDFSDSSRVCTRDPQVEIDNPAFKRLVEAYAKG